MQVAKNKIKNLSSSQPEVIHFKEMAESIPAEILPIPESPIAETPVEKPPEPEVVPAEQVEAQETQEQKEKRELNEYLGREIFTKFALTKEDEERILAEAPESRREVLARSFENTRNSLQAFYELETIKGVIDAYAFQKAERIVIYDALAPIMEKSIAEIQPKLTELGVDVSLSSLGFTPETADRNDLHAVLHDKGKEVEYKVRDQLRIQIDKSLLETGDWHGITIPTKEQLKDEQFMEERNTRFNRLEWEEKQAMLDNIGFGKWVSDTESKTDALFVLGSDLIPRADAEKCIVKKTKEEVTDSLNSEKTLAENTNFLCVNITADKLETVLTQGGFKDIFALNEEELREMERAEGRGGNFYFNYRKTVEEALGVYDPEVPTIYGTYASENGIDEKEGGADMYGSIFLKLKPTTEAVFCEGDSMSGQNALAGEKLHNLGIDTLDWANYARTRQIAPEHANLIKAMNNSYMKMENAIGRSVNNMGYIEAHIKGLNLDDVDSINVPRSIAESHEYFEDKGDYRSLINRLLQDPAWKDKIKII